jgi:hypothetical protein
MSHDMTVSYKFAGGFIQETGHPIGMKPSSLRSDTLPDIAHRAVRSASLKSVLKWQFGNCRVTKSIPEEKQRFERTWSFEPAPNMTLWNGDGQVHYEPLAVMEWKVNHRFNSHAHPRNRREHLLDLEWLQEKSSFVVGFTGYAVFVESTRIPRELLCARMQNGNVDQRGLALAA